MKLFFFFCPKQIAEIPTVNEKLEVIAVDEVTNEYTATNEEGDITTLTGETMIDFMLERSLPLHVMVKHLAGLVQTIDIRDD